MSSALITYTFTFTNRPPLTFSVNPRRNDAAAEQAVEGAPEWTRLGFHRCAHCALPNRHPHCPPALDSAAIVAQFADLPSTAPVDVTVAGAGRTCTKRTDAQTGLNALLGLLMATSACPTLSRLRSLALFHQPFASVEETLYRAVGDYLIKQYFVMRDGGQPDFALAGLDALYRDLAELNIAFFSRVQQAGPKDANVNAVVSLRSMSDIVSMSLEERLAPLREAME